MSPRQDIRKLETLQYVKIDISILNMNRILLEAAYNIETALTQEKAWDSLVKPLSRLKLDMVIYVTRDDTAAAWNILSTLPNNWPAELANDPSFSEPFVTYCCATFEPTKVGVEYLEFNEHYIDDYTRDYVSKTKEFGWTAGIGIPTCLKGSGRYGGFILGNNMVRYDFERIIMPLVDDLRTLCLVANARFGAGRKNDTKHKIHRPLSPRETQTLQMLSQGFRPKRIADELGLKESSIRLYIKNARAKLGAANNQDAVALFLKKGQVYAQHAR